jgi:anti-anti-sigma factor
LVSDVTDPAREPAAGPIEAESCRGVWVLSLRGEHDHSSQPSLREQLGHVRRAGGPIVVDRSHAEFLDSTVIAALAASGEDGGGRARERTMAIVAPRNHVGTRLIALVGIGSTIPTYPSRDAAAKAFTRGR